MRKVHTLSWMGLLAMAAIAIAFLCWFHFSTVRPDDQAVSAAENEVYEAVVREMVPPAHGLATSTQLVFDDTVLTSHPHEAGFEACQAGVREELRKGISTPPFNSFADKIYRGLTRGWDGGQLRADTIEDFVKKSCTGGPLSTAFHTDFPKVFIDSRSVVFDLVRTDGTAVRDFRKTFPEASGIIALSRVGFSPNLREAIVSSSYVCGMLCGTSWRYILRKKRGKWDVVDVRILWVS